MQRDLSLEERMHLTFANHHCLAGLLARAGTEGAWMSTAWHPCRWSLINISLPMHVACLAPFTFF